MYVNVYTQKQIFQKLPLKYNKFKIHKLAASTLREKINKNNVTVICEPL